MEKARGVVWDLSGLYKNEDDPQINKDIKTAIQSAQSFKQKYYGKIAAESCDSDLLLQALLDYELLWEQGYRPFGMATLLFSANGKFDKYKAMVAQVQESVTKLSNETLFFALEIQKIPENKLNDFFANGKLNHYRHHIESLRLFTPYTLAENEEQIINHKDLVRLVIL